MSSAVKMFQGVTGFGVMTVKMVAKNVYQERQQFLGEDATSSWEPSLSFCYNVLKKDLDFVHRKITQRKIFEEISDKQSTLMSQLKDQLACDFKDGVLPCFMIMSDELGLMLMPQDGFTWAQRGGKQVLVYQKEDKRQYTANIVHNAAGELVTFQIIYTGKTVNSLPSAARDNTHPLYDQAKDWVFGTTVNHWSNLAEKQKLIEKMVSYRDQKLAVMKRMGTLPASANLNDVPLVVILDCWPVNTSLEFRTWIKKTYAFIRLRYIPAGLTGCFQINDTHLHAPYKKWVKAEFNSWYSTKTTPLIQQRQNGDIDQKTFENSMNRLGSMPVVREMSVKFNIVALMKLQEKDASNRGENLIQIGWHTLYGDIFNLQFQTAAQQRILDRKKSDNAMVTAATAVSDDIAIANKEMETIGKQQQKKKDDILRKQKEDSNRKQKEERKKGEGVSSLVQEQLKRSISILNSGAANANNNINNNNNSNNSNNTNNNNNLNPVRDGNGQIHCSTNFDKDDANIDNRFTHNVVSAALTTSRKSPAPAGAPNHRKRTVSRATLQQSAKKRKTDGNDGSDGESEDHEDEDSDDDQDYILELCSAADEDDADADADDGDGDADAEFKPPRTRTGRVIMRPCNDDFLY
jgi:hypothetical protein